MKNYRAYTTRSARDSSISVFVLVLACLVLISVNSHAQENPAYNMYDIAKNLNNPLSAMVVAPLQNNTDVGISTFNGSRNTLNLPIIVPFSITPKLKLIARWDQLIITQYDITGEKSKQSGFGDAVVRLFFSPKSEEGKLTWGAGPALLLPVANEDAFASGKFGIGPAASVLMQRNGWTYGVLANQIWSVTGDEDHADYSHLYLQPFLAYNWKSGAGLAANVELTQDWEAETTMAFFNPVVSGITRLGKQTVSLAVGPRICLGAPEEARPDFGVRTVLTFIFLKRTTPASGQPVTSRHQLIKTLNSNRFFSDKKNIKQ